MGSLRTRDKRGDDCRRGLVGHTKGKKRTNRQIEIVRPGLIPRFLSLLLQLLPGFRKGFPHAPPPLGLSLDESPEGKGRQSSMSQPEKLPEPLFGHQGVMMLSQQILKFFGLPEKPCGGFPNRSLC
jgi:hypothetical protein